MTYVGAENPKTFVPVNLSNGVALTFTNSLTPSASGEVFLAKAEFTTLVNVSNNEFKIGIEKVKLVENINNFDETTSSNEIVFNQSSTTNTLNPFQIVWPLDGDINYDGQVDIPDFLLLVDNFGKTGVVPTSRMAIENALATGGSGTVVTSPQEERAKKMLGFWQFKGGILSTKYYILGHIHSERPLDDGEITVFGSSDLGVLVGGVYSQRLGKYTLLHNSILLNYFYVFNIQGNRAVGQLYVFYSSETISDASEYNLSSISGRTGGTGFTNYAGKPTVEQLDPSDQLSKAIIPQDIIDAHNFLKAILDQ